MKTAGGIKTNIMNTGSDKIIFFIRLIVGLIFISEGIQKYLVITMLGQEFFSGIGFKNPMFWAYFTGAFEMSCGLLILVGLLTRLASVPLLIIMIVAFIKTKLPLLLTRGFLTFAHEYRIDFSLTILLIMLMVYGGGKWSYDLKNLQSKSSKKLLSRS
jgi:putative oxidoreductase